MRNHLIRCQALRDSVGNEPAFALENELYGPIAPDTSLQQLQSAHTLSTQGSHIQAPVLAPSDHAQPPVLGPASPIRDPSVPGPSHQHQDADASRLSMQSPDHTAPPPPSHLAPQSIPGSARPAKNSLNTLHKVRQAMGRSTRRLESLEAVLKTQVSDGMNNAATHVRAAIRDEKGRLFRLSQTLVKQELPLREAQTSEIAF
ncbi:unnamed protein product [Discula destructiva]